MKVIRNTPFRGRLKKFPCVNFYDYPYNNTFPVRVHIPVYSTEWLKLMNTKGKIV